VATNDPKMRALALFKSKGGILRTKDALALGIHARTLYALRDEGALEQISRGIHRLTDLPPLTHLDLVTVALRIPAATVCLISALDYHGITTQVPHEVHVALPKGTTTPRLDHPPLRVFRFSGPALTIGIESVNLDGIPVRIYGVAKTVVDCFRMRNRIGLDVALEALRLGTERGLRPADLLVIARKCGVARVMTPYLEAMA
jgi:predicted transcriptional regulator of viral defense system